MSTGGPGAVPASKVGGRAVAAAAVGLMTAPLLWVAFSRPIRYTGDLAIIELRIRDVLSAHPPVAGAYSRYGWAHPGPWQFYLFALPYRLLGGDARALQITALVFNLLVAAVVLWLAARRDRAAAVVVGLSLLVLGAGLEPLSLSSGWNVTIAVFPMVLVAVASWRVLDGDRWALPILVAAALFVFAAHAGVGVVVLPLVVVTLAVVSRRETRPDVVRRIWTVTGAVTAIAVLPVAYDIVNDPPGNIGRLMRWSVTNDEPNVGVGDGLRMIGRSSSLSFLRDPEMPGRFLLELGQVDPGLLPGTSIALLIAALIVSYRRGWASERNWCSVVAILWATGIVAAASITRPVGWWLVQWMQPIGWLTWAAVVLVGWRLVTVGADERRLELLTRRALAIAMVVGTVAVAVHWRDALQTPDPAPEFTRPVDALTAALADTIDPRADTDPARLQHDGTPSLLAEAMLSGMVNRLDAIGVEVCIRESLAYKLGEHRVCADGGGTRFIVRIEPSSRSAPEGTSVVVVFDPLTPAQRAEADELTARIADVLLRAGLDDQVPILDSPLADAILVDDPPDELVALTDDVVRLAELRRIPGDRYVLYGTR